VWGLRFDIKTLDPAQANETITNGVLQQFFETLVDVDGQGQVQPELADKWTISPDGKTYQFHIRPGVTFSNKQPLTAEDAKFSFDRVANPSLSSTLAQSFLSPVAGAQAAIAGKANQVAGIVATRTDELTITLTHPIAAFLKQLACPGLSIVCHEGVPAGRFRRHPRTP
jgi:ABC-type transport system substrate-binding protein